MEVLAKDLFYCKDKEEMGTPLEPKMRMWHTCTKYKDRDRARVELTMIKEDADFFYFACPLCDFEYSLDKHLRLP